LRPTPIGDAYVLPASVNIPQPSYPIELNLCRGCGLAQLVDVIDPAVLYGDYIYVTSSSLGLDNHFRDYAIEVSRRCGLRQQARVVDIGSNDGTLLRQFKALGMRIVGIEPAADIAEAATASGVPTVNGFFSAELARRLVADYGHAQLATANNVFANIDDLQAWVEGIDVLLDDDGVFVFESFYLADVLQNMVFDFIYHEHLSAFSVKPMQTLFGRYGLELAAVQHVPTKGGSLRYFVQRPHGPLGQDGSVTAALAAEERAGLYKKQTYIDFAGRVSALKDATKSFLARARLEGKSIAGFGASITGTTLIYHFEIGEYIDYLVDDNPAKQGRYSPGLHLPVLPTSVLLERQPDYTVILAWRFVDAFMNKNQGYLEKGGSLIIPVPDFRVVTGVGQ
jgi:hypothetical protein